VWVGKKTDFFLRSKNNSNVQKRDETSWPSWKKRAGKKGEGECTAKEKEEKKSRRPTSARSLMLFEARKGGKRQ